LVYFYVTLIVIIGVGASLQLEESKMAAVMGLLGASLTALISLLNSIAGATPKQEKPEFEIMKELIVRLNRMADRDPMAVHVRGQQGLSLARATTKPLRRGNNVSSCCTARCWDEGSGQGIT